MERWKKVQRVPTPALIPPYGPLAGMRVLMTGNVVAAPFAAGVLAEYGAEVIHVERPGVGDRYRGQDPMVTFDEKEQRFVLASPDTPRDRKVSTGWIQEARNKLSFTLELNMRVPEAKDIFLSLIKNCDVWIENLVWLEKLGLSDEMALEANPRLVIAHISGFGRPQFGGVPEECDRPSYDPIGQAEGGYMFLNGYPEPMPPMPGASFINDYMTAMFCVSGILMAYIHAQKTGEGQVVDVSQVECMSKCLNDTFVNYLTLGAVKERYGTKLPISQPGDVYKTKDGYIYLMAFGPVVYNRALQAMGIDYQKYSHAEAGASSEAVNSPLGRELDGLIRAWLAERTSEEAMAQFRKYKVPCGIPRSVADLASSEHYRKRGNFVEYEDQTLGRKVKAYGFAPKMSKTRPQVWRGAPRLGQDTERVLRKILGYGDAEIEALKGRGIID
ncbi:Crotonobetainyl-CoA:carnitine CoA-transferase CaiB [Desulfacinum infernum DSM 9756]|uniref:Crotonobetainyl-CoA:carnitine CoA-transferase CaiB n=1 Tax=Desulfacinum infernum DSM 9756 TaxID=1121391 RepID=A0A1M5G631_9BACT|nr:CoA transferase [Desulfacinum infernum]SHF99247.1 Crotonobetainyl-CoA:carnitine CoA-transferase CaiB [Desulfacinum infernum DSM 9756]